MVAINLRFNKSKLDTLFLFSVPKNTLLHDKMLYKYQYELLNTQNTI